MEVKPKCEKPAVEEKETKLCFWEVTQDTLNDLELIKFCSYSDYLNSFMRVKELDFLDSSEIGRHIVGFGYIPGTRILSKEEFHKRSESARKNFFLIRNPLVSVAEGACKSKDIVVRELALRELSNLRGSMATIIFIRDANTLGHEVSSYIDYRDRLSSYKMGPFFQEKQRLKAKKTDLSYYHWRNDKIFTNPTKNFAIQINPRYGLVFRCKHDNKEVIPDKKVDPSTKRTVLISNKYKHVVLYDHRIEKLIYLS